ncbi:tyrosine--tRNA ligase [Dehalococcoidia bacterium]|nr:tyrosine--tRNA ligase [Dehalococcoidia bacterium]
MTDNSELVKALRRGVSETIVESELLELLQSGKPVRLKMGFDPSGPDIHLGHVVGLRKLREFQEMGHKVVLIVGDWTAQIGDPSGRSQTRKMLSAQEVKDNAETYMAQFFDVVDKQKTEVRWQSEWFGDFSLADLLDLTSRFTVAQFLAREDFSKRFQSNQPIAITELLYPLLQAYDSVAIKSDIEFGGMDQKFNLLVGRDLQGMMGGKAQQLVLMPILVGTDGVQKMSKSLGNYIALKDSPRDMFGKTMSLPDSAIVDYFDLLTNVTDSEVNEMRHQMMEETVNPIDLKKQLGMYLVRQFHDVKAATEAQAYFEQVVQSRETPADIPTLNAIDFKESIVVQDGDFVANLPSLFSAAGFIGSSSEGRRLIAQGAVTIDGERVNELTSIVSEGTIFKIGKRKWVRITNLPTI